MGICNRISFPYPQTFLSVGISNETSFSYPQTFHSVGISNETSFSYPQTFHSVGISNKTSFSYPQTIHVEAEEWVQRSLILSPVPTLRRKKGTEKFVPVPCAHAAAEEGYREACPCHLCPRCDGRRAQRSLLLSSVPILRRKKGTEKLAPVPCAHAAAEEWAQAEFVLSTATLRYEPCTQFINVSQRALHIYWQFSAMSHAIHKIVSKRRCQSYYGFSQLSTSEFLKREMEMHETKNHLLCGWCNKCL